MTRIPAWLLDLSVTPGQLDQSASVFLTEAELGRNVLTTFKAQVQILQDMYQPVSPDTWAKLMTDLDIYTNEYHDSLAGIGSGLRGNYVEYTDIERANSRLLAIDGYTPIDTFDVSPKPAFRHSVDPSNPSDMSPKPTFRHSVDPSNPSDMSPKPTFRHSVDPSNPSDPNMRV